MDWLLVLLVLLTACSAPATPTTRPVTTPLPVRTEEATPAGTLDLTILYPGEDTEMEMGQSTKLTVQVTDLQGDAVSDAQVTITVRDPQGEAVAAIPASHGGEGVYRTADWTLPHRVLEGTWDLLVEARVGQVQGNCPGSFEVKNSPSETLLAKYGFWIGKPNLCAEPGILEEKGDARNGMIRWGGAVPGMHIKPANYVEVHWREGDHGLEDPQAVRRFMLEGVGDLKDVRTIGPIQPLPFKGWEAWRAEGRTYSWEEIEWVVFYAPEVDRTFAIATILTLPPSIPDPHGRLRDSFALFPDVHATGVALEPLPRLLPGPELVNPPLAARFQGVEQPVTLRWKPVKELAEDEYYKVAVDYIYKEAWPVVAFTTRETQLTLPETLYRSPNCGFFNWRVTLKRQTRLGDDGQPIGEAVSYPSLYWYFWWQHPPGEQDFPPACPYTQLD